VDLEDELVDVGGHGAGLRVVLKAAAGVEAAAETNQKELGFCAYLLKQQERWELSGTVVVCFCNGNLVSPRFR
jgi:hypothetical protein